jgi:hypothetical protein
MNIYLYTLHAYTYTTGLRKVREQLMQRDMAFLPSIIILSTVIAGIIMTQQFFTGVATISDFHASLKDLARIAELVFQVLKREHVCVWVLVFLCGWVWLVSSR